MRGRRRHHLRVAAEHGGARRGWNGAPRTKRRSSPPLAKRPRGDRPLGRVRLRPRQRRHRSLLSRVRAILEAERQSAAASVGLAPFVEALLSERRGGGTGSIDWRPRALASATKPATGTVSGRCCRVDPAAAISVSGSAVSLLEALAQHLRRCPKAACVTASSPATRHGAGTGRGVRRTIDDVTLGRRHEGRRRHVEKDRCRGAPPCEHAQAPVALGLAACARCARRPRAGTSR